MKWVLIIFLIFFFYYCTNKKNLDIAGNYYVCYKDGEELAETDSLNQLYFHLKRDNTYQLIDRKGVESGWWRTNDYDDFSITYFYNSYLRYLLDGPVGETVLNYLPDSPDIKVFVSPTWNVHWKRDKYLSHQMLFYKLGERIKKEDAYALLKRKFGDNLITDKRIQ